LLPPCDAQRVLKSVLGLVEPVETQQRGAFEAIKLRLPATLACLFLDIQRLPERSESLLMLSFLRDRFGEPG
jgi:hypothetical protein